MSSQLLAGKSQEALGKLAGGGARVQFERRLLAV